MQQAAEGEGSRCPASGEGSAPWFYSGRISGFQTCPAFAYTHTDTQTHTFSTCACARGWRVQGHADPRERLHTRVHTLPLTSSTL